MVYNRIWVIIAETYARPAEYFPRGAYRVVQPAIGQAGQFRAPSSNIGSGRIELLPLIDWIENAEVRRRIRSATGNPLPTEVFWARSASTRVSQNHRSPACHGSGKSFTRKLAMTIRARLCIQPVFHNSRMPASTIGNPVRHDRASGYSRPQRRIIC